MYICILLNENVSNFEEKHMTVSVFHYPEETCGRRHSRVKTAAMRGGFKLDAIRTKVAVFFFFFKIGLVSLSLIRQR